jgi:2-isopropylmalate synthase
MCARSGRPELWEVPYLPIDPSDVGRTYESIIRINSQSGKGGVAYVMEKDYGLKLPKEMHPEFGQVIQGISDKTGKEVTPAIMWEAFEKQYLKADAPYSLGKCRTSQNGGDDVEIHAVVRMRGSDKEINGKGNGPIDAFSNALRQHLGIDLRLLSYYEHAVEMGSDSRAAAYIRIECEGIQCWGAGIDTSIDRASFKAILSALNRTRQ